MELRETDPDFDALSVDPYALCPEGERQGPDGPDRMMPVSVTYDKDLKAWTNPYFMAPMNAKVVRRTNALTDYAYGRDFSYSETAMTTGGLGGWWAAMRYALFGRAFLIAMAIPATRRWLKRRVLPKSGEGPSAETRETGYYELIQVGEMPDGTILKARITGRAIRRSNRPAGCWSRPRCAWPKTPTGSASAADSGHRPRRSARSCATGSANMPG
jgi:short subunit dehydrogenase-like uncharacterized protein